MTSARLVLPRRSGVYEVWVGVVKLPVWRERQAGSKDALLWCGGATGAPSEEVGVDQRRGEASSVGC